MTKPPFVSLARRFATMAALLAGIAMLAIAGASWWLINQEHAASLRSLLKKDAELQATSVSSKLHAIAARMSELANSSLIANALVDNANKERFLVPFLNSLQRIHDVSVAILFTDFEGRQIAHNGNDSFSEQELNWLREKFPAAQPAARVQLGEKGEELIAVEFIVHSRLNSAEGALLYRIKLDELPLQKGVRLVRSKESEQLSHSPTAIAAAVNVPPIYKHFDFAVLISPDPTARSVDWQRLGVFFILAVGMVVTVIILGLHFGKRLTRDLLSLQFFARDVAEKGFGTGRAEAADSLEVESLAQSINRMLAHLRQEHDKLNESESEQKRISAMLQQNVREMAAIQFALDQHAIVSITDLLGNITYANDLFSKISDYPREELMGKNHRLINSNAHSQAYFEDLWQTIGAGRVWHGEICNRNRSGSLYWVQSTIVPLLGEDGRPEQYIAIRTDISAHKEAESELLRAKDAAEQADQVKSNFLANMSHEIRTPLNGIIGMTELALDTELNAEQREYLGLVKVSADALLHIVNDILDFSKIEAGLLKIEIIEFSLEQMLHDTMKTLAARAHQKDLELLLHVAPDVPDRLIGDPGRLRQVLVNLVGNAIKFTQTGEIEVAVHRLKAITPTQTELRFSVRDTGIGIAREKFKAVFDSFSQADTSTTRQYGGTGLGLSISAQLVSLMGGHIELESELGQGSTFTFTLSLATGSNDAYASYQSTGRVVGLPVLIADDNATNRSLLVQMLRNWQMLPTAVESGEQALQELERASASATPYALAILDVQMPVMDGFELAQRILAQPKYVGATVMMLTSEDQRGQATRCRELGVASYLMKPITQSELLDAIMTALGEPLQSSTPLITRHSLRENRRRLKLLLAEDNAVNQTLAVRLLQKLGHTVTVANNGLEAVEHWQAGGFDAILMDVDMPIMNGYEATERIRAIETTSHGLVPAHTPIVAMTAHAMRGAREECLSRGMDAYLAKPIDTEALWRELDGLMPASVAEPEVAPATAVPPCAKVADFAAARQTMDDDRKLFEEIVRLFQSDAPVRMQQILEALARGESEAVHRGAHSIKGMAGIFSAERTVQAAARLEELAALGSLKPGAVEAAAELEAAMADLQAALLLYQW